MATPIDTAFRQLERLHDLLSQSHRDVRDGIAVAHTFTTPEYIEIMLAVRDIKHSLEEAGFQPTT